MFKESKPGVQTSEFKAFILAAIAVVGPIVAGVKLDTAVDRWKAGLYVGAIVVLAIAYIVSRGLAKQGAPFDDTGDALTGQIDGLPSDVGKLPVEDTKTPEPPPGG